MNLILFKNVISKFWKEDMNQEMVIFLICATFILVPIEKWKDVIIARDSGLVSKSAIFRCSKPQQKTKAKMASSKVSKVASSKNILNGRI